MRHRSCVIGTVGAGAREERSRREGRRDAGMSLLEMTVLLAVLSVVTLMILPQMERWLGRYQLRAAGDQVAFLLQTQRQRAVAANRPFSLQFDVAAETITLIDGDASLGGTVIVPGAQGLPSSVDFDTGAGDPVSLSFGGTDDIAVFHADGTMNDRNAVIDSILLIGRDDATLTVQVEGSSGRVTVGNIVG